MMESWYSWWNICGQILMLYVWMRILLELREKKPKYSHFFTVSVENDLILARFCLTDCVGKHLRFNHDLIDNNFLGMDVDKLN